MDTADKLTTLTGDAISPKLLRSIENIIQNEGYTSYNIEVKLQPSDGGSFLGILHEVNVRGKTSQGEKELNIFAKSILSGDQMALCSVPRVYEREAYCYNELFNIFIELQDQYNVPIEYRYNIAKGYETNSTEFIIMENLSKRGFVMRNRMEATPFNVVKKCMQQLAKFHALSFVIEEKKPDYFEEKIKNLEHNFTYGSDTFNACAVNTSILAATCLDPISEEKVKKFIPTSLPKYKYYCGDPTSVRCLCHGDYRPSNIMVKYENGKITDLIPVDYQFTCYGCPIVDFMYYIFCSTDQEFRRDHLEDIKDVYHNTLTKFLKYFDMDVEKYYSRKEFERLYKERLDYGLMLPFWGIPIILADVGEIPDVTETNLTTMTIKPNETVKSRLHGIVDDFIQWGYL